MNRHSGLHRHSLNESFAGDPLDGLVNLFDIGIVLAVAFLIVGLSAALHHTTHNPPSHPASAQQPRSLPSTAGARPASGRGQPVGTVYRLADGQLIYVQKQR